MKKINTSVFKIALLAFLFAAITVSAQKLPSVQTASFRAPATIKIDGKSTEWNNKFQAYNNATNIFYTIANDDENLYLVVQATDPNIINRVVGGGVTLGIQKSGKKTDKDNMSITFPLTDHSTTLVFNLRGRKGVVQDTSARAADSVMRRNNKTLAQKSKWIGLTGIKDLDSLISVYNTDGIRAVGLFDVKKVYTFEMSIALKHLGLSAKDGTKFAYHIKVNGAKNLFGNMTIIPAPGSTPEQVASMEKMSMQMSQQMATQSAPTDFWGEYTMVKK